MVHTLVIVEGNDDVEVLKNSLDSLQEYKIISFDFLAHKSLRELDIDHSIVEDYFSEEDKSNIDNKAIELTTSWYKQKEITKHIEFNEMNLGNILELEFLGYFFLHLKRIFGITKIVEKETPVRIISSFLADFVNAVCKGKQIQTIRQESKIRSGLYYDTIEIPISLGAKIITLKISRKNFFILKKITEILTNLFFRLEPNMQSIKNNKTILFQEFNPVMYSDLLISTTNLQQNVILLNQRRPAVWNFQSFKIVKNSKCKVLQLDYFNKEKVKQKINDEKSELMKRLDALWLKDDIFSSIFSIEGHSFWSAIKVSFIEITTKRFLESIEKYLLFESLFDNINVSCLLEWAHVGMEEKIAVFLANKKKIPSIYLQHGMHALNSNYEKYIDLIPYLPSNGTKEAVWGSIMKEFITSHNIKSDEIIDSGSPRHDIFFKNREHIRNENTVLIATNELFHNNFNGTDTRAFERLEYYIKKICEIVSKTGNKKLIVKLHPSMPYYDIKTLIRQIDSNIQIYQNQNIFDLLLTCDSMISLNYSTVLLDAMILNKPTMLILPEEQNIKEEILIKRKATLCVSNTSEIETSLKDLLYNENVRNELIQRGNEFVDDYLTNQGSASERLASILKNYS